MIGMSQSILPKDHARSMEDHPSPGNCQDLAKIMTGSQQDHSKKYPMPRFK